MDQAYKLRDLVRNKKIAELNNTDQVKQAKVITVTSGKGGVGKTNFVLNLAINLKRQGFNIIIIDTDFGLANIEILLGSAPKYNFYDLILGKKNINDIIVEGPEGIQFISGGSGIAGIANLSEQQLQNLVYELRYLYNMTDIILIDTGAGINKSVINFVMASDECILLTTPEPTALIDGYAILKTINIEKEDIPKVSIVVNRVEDRAEGNEVFSRLSKVSDKFLNIKLNYLGSIPYDNFLIKSVKVQKPVSVIYPNSNFNLSLKSISNKLIGTNEDIISERKGIFKFIKRVLNNV